jgi:predicted RNA polymerase sigma factor
MGMAFGPQAGLDIADILMRDTMLRHYHLLPAVRGDLLAKLGRRDEARAEFERAAMLAQNSRDRELMRNRAGTLRPADADGAERR